MAVKVHGGGKGYAYSSERILLRDGVRLADVSDAVGSVAFDFAVGAVAEMQIPAVDIGARLAAAGLLTAGTTLTYDAAAWQVAAVERDYRRPDVWLNITARSQLARRLRNMLGPDKSDGKVTPQQWITTRAKKAGASTVRVEPGASRRVITQKRGESVLQIIEALASDTGTEWVEFDGQLYVGTAWWALHDLGLTEWVAPLDGPKYGSDLAYVGFQSRSSDMDRQDAASATLTVEAQTGLQVRPWHRVRIADADPADNGLWLVTGNAWDDSTPSATITLSRPLKSAPKKGSTGLGNTDNTSTLDGDWIQGADKVWPRCTRSPRQYVAYAQKQAAAGAGFRQNGCLEWVSIALSGKKGLGGYYARYVWERAPASAVKSPGDTDPPIGAIVVWGPPTGGGAGHVGISVGGGRFISATGGRVVELNIAGFGSYYGAMTPSF